MRDALERPFPDDLLSCGPSGRYNSHRWQPRLLTIVARFGAEQSLRDLMGNLFDLVDDHTEYFKSHLDSLPVQERRVYLALARLWKPATTKEIGDLARLDTNRCSALLRRLLQRGAVTVEGGTARRRQYYLTERLYNIYYLLRRGAGAAAMVEALVQFMASYYSPLSYWKLVNELRLKQKLVTSGQENWLGPHSHIYLIYRRLNHTGMHS